MSDTSTTPSSSRKSSSKEVKAPKDNPYQKGKVVKILRSQIVLDGDVNPRIIREDNAKRLKKSLKEHGLVGHLVWNKANGHIIGGHQRLEQLDSLIKAQEYSLEVLMVDIGDPKEELKLNVALNNQDAMGEFDYDLLDSLAVEYGFDPVEDLGFSEELVEVSFPEVNVIEEQKIVAEEGEEAVAPRMASAEDIALMKAKKADTREKMKDLRYEEGDYKTEAKGVLTLVFPQETQKREWMESKGLDPEANVVHIEEFLEALGVPEDFEGVDIDELGWKERVAKRKAKEQAEMGVAEEGDESENSEENSSPDE